MAGHSRSASRIVIVGGGISGLSIAARLAQARLPVTLLEASSLGFGASTRNQGWLYSGAWFAPDDSILARMCYESLQQTIRFAPSCPEPNCGPMVYLTESTTTDIDQWTTAWAAAGIPYRELTPVELYDRLPEIVVARGLRAFELPDRAMRTGTLLRALADAAQNEGAEIRTGTPVARLIKNGECVEGVETGTGETISARLVILAGNAKGGFLYPGFGSETVGSQPEVALVAQKTHLVALQPGICRSPMCVIDAEGFNHIPHPPSSVFGTNRWLPVRDAEDEHTTAAELRRIWEQIERLFPDVRRDDYAVTEWAGTTVQAMHADQVIPGRVPLPTVVDHSRESPRTEGLLSVFPGRASLWPHLAEQTQRMVLRMLDMPETRIAKPPWGQMVTQPQEQDGGGVIESLVRR